MFFRSSIGVGPRIALGTAKVHGSACIDYVHRGLAAGYRMIDTAQVYGNEEEIGEAIRSFAIPRQQVFVTTKIASGFKKNPISVKEAADSARASLCRLGLGYVDTILIHHPGDDAMDSSAADSRRKTWHALEDLVYEGCVRSIGVSNFDASHILEMRQYARITPCVNQLELHPWFQQRKLVDLCKKEKIDLHAYSAIAGNIHSEDIALQVMAEQYNISTAQLLICYSVHKGYTPIVKATSTEHIYANKRAENIRIHEKDIIILDSWDKGAEGSLCTSLHYAHSHLPLKEIVPWLTSKIDT